MGHRQVVGVAYDILVRSGRTPSLDYFETSWEWKGPAEDALEDIVCFIEMQGGSASRDLIKKFWIAMNKTV